MSTITKEQAKDLRNAFQCWQQDYDPVEDKEQYDMFGLSMVAMDALLASLEAEPVAYMYKDRLHTDARFSLHTRFGNWSQEDINEYEITEIPLYTAPPAPVSVPDELTREEYKRRFMEEDNFDDTFRGGWSACRAAMLQGAEPDFREISNSSTKHFRENAETSTKCWCRTCRPVTFADSHFVVCPECGNKRCPHANDHRHACTGSNEPCQEGSAYPAAPQQEVK
ncbi:hypothetical protein [Enterobacter cloacae]